MREYPRTGTFVRVETVAGSVHTGELHSVTEHDVILAAPGGRMLVPMTSVASLLWED